MESKQQETSPHWAPLPQPACQSPPGPGSAVQAPTHCPFPQGLGCPCKSLGEGTMREVGAEVGSLLLLWIWVFQCEELGGIRQALALSEPQPPSPSVG